MYVQFILLSFENDKDINENEYVLKCVRCDSHISAVSAIGCLEGHIILGLGNSLRVYDWPGMDLLCYYDCSIFISSMSIVKNLIVVGDVIKSVMFLVWIEEHSLLMLLCKDNNDVSIDSCNIIVYKNELGIVISDKESNILYYQYDPIESKERLKLCGDIYMGSRILNLSVLICNSKSIESNICNSISNEVNSSVSNEKEEKEDGESIISCLSFGSLDGNIGYLIPINEIYYKRLYVLQGVLRNVLIEYCGVNPKEYRNAKSEYVNCVNNVHNIIDGCLIWRYNNIEFSIQRDLGHAIGSTCETILETLRFIDSEVISM